MGRSAKVLGSVRSDTTIYRPRVRQSSRRIALRRTVFLGVVLGVLLISSEYTRSPVRCPAGEGITALDSVESGHVLLTIYACARTATFLVFDTDDVTAETAPFVGTERLIRGDLYHGQPCPTDPPSYEYSWLFDRFQWDYYICHTFDSPW